MKISTRGIVVNAFDDADRPNRVLQMLQKASTAGLRGEKRQGGGGEEITTALKYSTGSGTFQKVLWESVGALLRFAREETDISLILI